MAIYMCNDIAFRFADEILFIMLIVDVVTAKLLPYLNDRKCLDIFNVPAYTVTYR